MKWLSQCLRWARLRPRYKRQNIDEDMDAEMRAHLQMQMDANVADGMNEETARRAARVDFGAAESIKGICREQRRFSWIDNMRRDVRFAGRMLWKTPGFSAVAILTLALGLGANLALFSLLNDQLLRPRDVSRPDELWAILPSDQSGEPKFYFTSRFYYEAIRKNSVAFSDVIGLSNLGVKLRTGDGWQEKRAHFVSGEFFGFLGVPPALGRGFLPEEDKPGAHNVTVISYHFWQDHFQASPQALGKTINLDNQLVEVVGVAPLGFKGISMYQPDFWLPASMETLFGAYPVYNLVGRLKPGYTPRQAADLLAPVVQDTTRNLLASGDEVYTNNISNFSRVALRREGYGSLPAQWVWEGRKELATAATLVGAATVMVLLIAAINLSNLQLARALSRRKEIATRFALGATQWSVVRQFALEGVILAGLGSAAALLMLFCLGNSIVAFMPSVVFGRADLDLHPDIRVVAFALISSVLVGVGFTVLPAWQAGRVDPFTTLKDPEGGTSSVSRRFSLRHWLIVTQVAASLVLLVGTGLCLGAFSRLLKIDVGYPAAASIATVPLHFERVGFSPERARTVVEDLRHTLGQLPGVNGVGLIDMLPLIGQRGHLVTDRLEGFSSPAGSQIDFGYRAVGPNCFRALGIGLVEGRDISEMDWSANRAVALVNESFVRRFWPNQNPLGKQIERLHRNYEIIGVARDARFNVVAQPPEPTMFFAMDRSDLMDVNFVVRAKGDPRLLLAPIFNVLAGVHPGLRESQVHTLGGIMRNQLGPQRQAMDLLGSLALVALSLTVLGVYGLMVFLVGRRKREIGIRLAAGAQRSAIARLFFGFGMRVGLAGVSAGLVLAFCGALLLRHAVFGVRAFDLPAFLSAAAAIFLAVLLACAVPVLRATRIDPMSALRHE